MLHTRLMSAVGLLLLCFAASCTPMAPPAASTEAGRYLVYFNEFSAHFSDDAQNVVREAARYAKANGVKAVRIEGRASATGSAAANRYLAQTRTQIVYDELQKDGVDPATMSQDPIGQTGSPDTSVMNRRVDIVLLK